MATNTEAQFNLGKNLIEFDTQNKAELTKDHWHDPIILNKATALSVFPTYSLPSPGRDIVETVASINQVDAGLPGSLYLACLSTCLGGNIKINLGTHVEPCNTFFAQVLDSGERKSRTVSIMIHPILQYEQKQKEEKSGVIREARNKYAILEARLVKLQKKAAEEDREIERKQYEKDAFNIAEELAKSPILTPPVYLFDNITPEKLGALMAENQERGSIISAEGGIFDIMAGRYSEGNADLDIFLKAHAGDAWNCHRIGRTSVEMISPALTISLAVQSSVIREIGGHKRFRGRGLLARFLFSFCQSQVGYRERQTARIPDSLLQQYTKHLHELLSLSKNEIILTLSVEAQDLWDDFYNYVERNMRPGASLEGLKDWGSKLPGAVARIAGLLHCAENGLKKIEEPISFDTVKAATIIGDYFKEHALFTFGFMGEDPKIEAAKLILEYVMQNKPQTFQGRDILRNKNAFKSMEEVLPGLNILIERGYIRQKEELLKAVTGRPKAPAYEVNPKIL